MKKLSFLILAILMSTISYTQTGWVKVTDSIPNLYIMSMQFTSANTGYACGSYGTQIPGAVLRTTNGGLNWIVTQFPEYSADDLTFLNDNTGYISAWQGPGKSYVLKTTNGGVNWNKLDSNGSSFFKIKFYDSNNGMIVSKYNTSHRTTNGGISWTTVYGSALWLEPNSLICLNAETWLVADKGSGIIKTTNGGANWEHIYSSNMQGVSMYFLNSTTGFLVDYYAKVFKTTNAGNNWFKIDSIANVNYFNDANIIFTDNSTGYITSGNYVYKTTNGGYNWNRLLVRTNYSIYSSYFINANTGFVGGTSGIIYRTTTGGTIGVNNISTEEPSKYSLSQNYPNPFNPTTKIRFGISRVGQESQFVTLKVFDVMGREVQILVNESLQPGTYEITFDGSKLTSGIYFYRIITTSYTETKRMLLIK